MSDTDTASTSSPPENVNEPSNATTGAASATEAPLPSEQSNAAATAAAPSTSSIGFSKTDPLKRQEILEVESDILHFLTDLDSQAMSVVEAAVMKVIWDGVPEAMKTDLGWTSSTRFTVLTDTRHSILNAVPSNVVYDAITTDKTRAMRKEAPASATATTEPKSDKPNAEAEAGTGTGTETETSEGLFRYPEADDYVSKTKEKWIEACISATQFRGWFSEESMTKYNIPRHIVLLAIEYLSYLDDTATIRFNNDAQHHATLNALNSIIERVRAEKILAIRTKYGLSDAEVAKDDIVGFAVADGGTTIPIERIKGIFDNRMKDDTASNWDLDEGKEKGDKKPVDADSAPKSASEMSEERKAVVREALAEIGAIERQADASRETGLNELGRKLGSKSYNVRNMKWMFQERIFNPENKEASNATEGKNATKDSKAEVFREIHELIGLDVDDGSTQIRKREKSFTNKQLFEYLVAEENLDRLVSPKISYYTTLYNLYYLAAFHNGMALRAVYEPIARERKGFPLDSNGDSYTQKSIFLQLLDAQNSICHAIRLIREVMAPASLLHYRKMKTLLTEEQREERLKTLFCPDPFFKTNKYGCVVKETHTYVGLPAEPKLSGISERSVSWESERKVTFDTTLDQYFATRLFFDTSFPHLFGLPDLPNGAGSLPLDGRLLYEHYEPKLAVNVVWKKLERKGYSNGMPKKKLTKLQKEQKAQEKQKNKVVPGRPVPLDLD